MAKREIIILRPTSGVGVSGVTQATDATAADHVFVSGGADRSRVETPVTIDPVTGDVAGIGEMDVTTVVAEGIELTTAPGTDDTARGIYISGRNAGATIAQWEAVYLGASSTWLLADANGTGTYPARGLAMAAYTSGNAAAVFIHGIVRNDAWNWTPGGTIYLSATAGAITQTAPSTAGDKVQAIGYAITADIAFFDFNSAYVEVA